MQTKTIKQFSLLGLSLIAVSAIVAAVIPAKTAPAQVNTENDGRVLVNSGIGGTQVPAIFSCVAQAGNKDCHLSVSGTGATGTLAYDMFGVGYETVGNTSLSSPVIAGDTTSLLGNAG